MRKIALSSLLAGLALALSSCVLVVPPVYNFRFESNWQRTDTGAYVFCSNQTTLMRYKFRAPNLSLIQAIEEKYEGYASGNTLILNRPITDLIHEGSDLVFEGILNFGQNGVPQSLPPGVSQQSITVTPIQPPTSEAGRTTVTVTVTTTSGSQYSGSYTYYVYSNCP